MNDLTNLPPQRPTSPELSPGLSSLLGLEPDDQIAVRQIAGTPALLEEARAKLGALRRYAMSAAGEAGVQAVIGKRFGLYPQTPRSEPMWAAWWSDYTDALEDVPESALEAGMAVWVKRPDSQFLPKPGELRALALSTPNRAARAYERAKGAVDYQPPRTYQVSEIPDVKPRILRDEPNAADKARVQRILADYQAEQDARPRAAVNIRPNHGAVDEHGITQALRDSIAKRNESRA